jgi:ABC-type transport system involved in cytochrome c biogenesis permease subunit
MGRGVMRELRMTKLPLRPVLFVPAYFLSLATVMVPLLLGQTFTMAWVAVAVSLALILQLWWTYRAVAFASQVTDEPGKHSSRTTIKYLLLVICIGAVYAAIFPSFVKPHLVGTPFEAYLGVDSPVMGLVVCLVFLAVFWVAARVVCEAEAKGKVPAHSVVGTFLLFFYIIIGAPFIYGRLKRLGSADMRVG